MRKIALLAALALVTGLMALGVGQALARAPLVVDDNGVQCPNAGFTTIQAAVNAASAGDQIRVCAGVYAENVVIATSGITLKAAPGAILDGSTLGNGDGITIQSGVSGVTIKYFEIRNYNGISSGVGNAIQSWNCGTSDISVIGNYMHDNAWNAILVGNEGEALHYRWSVKDNTVVNNGFYNIELTNTQDSEIKNNVVTGPGGQFGIGILLQARNFTATPGYNYLGCGEYPFPEIVASGNVISSGNVVSGFKGLSSWGGIFLLAFSDGTGARLTETLVSENEAYDNNYGIIVYGFGLDVVDKSRISENNAHHNPSISGVGFGDGIRLINGDDSLISDNTVTANGRHGIRLGGGSTGNQVSDNTATGNGGFDLIHDATSTPNTWRDNTCGTKSGTDIPAC
ncbi:MAG: hypothetical protein A2148_07725 [Chloroflexi bacterium RBG_16_68_14]|nr:MAG: hypothetical protein A2148_07725 [Chloroflexi bacterium RBG_16_68_14]